MNYRKAYIYRYFNFAGFTVSFVLHPLTQESIFKRRSSYLKFLNINFGVFKDDGKKKVDFTINILDVKSTKIISDSSGKYHYINYYKEINKYEIDTYYTNSPEQIQIILRNILLKLLLENNGMLVHASCAIDTNGFAYLFVGPSGAGKSTIIRLLSKKYKPFTDDYSIVRKISSHYYIYQTPIIEKNLIKKVKKKYQLKAIYSLEKARTFRIKKINDLTYKISLFCNQIFTNKEEDRKFFLLSTVSFLRSNIPFYIMEFKKDQQFISLK